MKKTQWKDAIRNIGKKKVSWISIIIVVMLTVSVFLGCRFYTDSLKNEGENYFKIYYFKDIDVISSTGILASEIEKIAKVEGVIDVEGYHQIDATAQIDGDNKPVKLIRKTDRISIPDLEAGELPEECGEIAVSRILAKEKGIKIGDSIHIVAAGDQGKLLACNDFKVTAIVNHPEFYTVRENDFMMASDASFKTDQLNGGYMRAIVRCEITEGTDIFTEAYFEQVAEVEDRIRALFPGFAVTHEEELRAMAEERIAEESEEGRKKLEDARKELDDGKKRLEEGRDELLKGEAKLELAKKEIEDGETQIPEKEQLLAEGKVKLDEGAEEIKNAEAKLADGKRQLAEKKAAGEQQLNAAKAKLEAAEKEANSGAQKLNRIESILRDLSKLTGNGDLPGGYYTMKNRAIEYYRPAMEALVQQKDNTALLARAKSSVDSEVEYVIGDLADIEEILRLAGSVGLSRLAGALNLGNVSSGMTKYLLKAYFNAAGKAGAAVNAVNFAKKTLAAEEQKARTELAKAQQTIDEAEAKLAEGKREYEEKLAQYNDGLKQLEEGKEKLEKGKAEYEDGLKTFNEKKKEFDEGKKKLEDGEKEYAEGEKEYEEKLAEAQNRINDLIDSSFAVQNRRANSGYVNLRTNINTISMASIAFIVLFLIICALVAFSTIVIIVDEQRILAGTMKSLGFFNRAIRAKYLVFGLSASFIGIILGVVLSAGIEDVFRYGITEMFVTGVPGFVFHGLPLVICVILVVAVVITATFVACRNMLKLSAIQLMSGMTKQKSLRGRKKKEDKPDGKNSKKGGIYSRLIVRNMRTELARVMITTLIIACSCGLIGVGFTLKYAFAGMVKLQVSDVWNYDIRITYDPDKTEDSKAEELEAALKKAGADFATAMEMGTIYRDGMLQEYTYILVLDQSSVGTYYHVIDKKSGDEMKLPENGVLIQNRLKETQGLKNGDTYILYDQKLKEHIVTVKGVYVNHVGRTVIMSRNGYEAVFGKKAVDNVYMVHLNGADPAKMEKEILDILPEATIGTADKLHEGFVDIENSYNTVVLLLTGLAILMSIFVLANLTNIFVSRRRKELVIMRVNGFSMKQCIGYLIRETLTTTLLGFAIAIGLGGLIAYFLVRLIEQPDAMLNRSFMPMCWIAAILLEGLFATCINAFVFRKVRKIKVTDINN